MKTNKKELLDSFKGGLIVSCQVQHDDPTFSVDFVVKMAKAAQWGGAVGIRANDPEQIKAIKKEVDLPVIGLWKIWHDDTDVFITPTLEAAKQGDSLAKQIVDDYISKLAAGISTFITIFRPQVIILGGGIAHAGDLLLKPLNEKLHTCTFAAEEIGIPQVIRAELGNDAGIIGAALLEKTM